MTTTLTSGEVNIWLEAFGAQRDAFVAEQPPVLARTIPITELGYDISCADDVDELMSEVDGLVALAQAVYRRITTPRGMVIDAPDYGRDLRSLLHKGMTPARRDAELRLYEDEVKKDERIRSCTVSGVLSDDGATLRVTVACESDIGPFTLTIDATQTTTALREARL